MGAIERDGYVFEMEYSVISKKGAVHVFQNGNCIDEIPFEYSNDIPNHSKVEALIDTYLEEK